MFEKSLTDLVRGIRNNKKNEAKYISTCVQEIKEELRSDNPNKKAVAIQKLTYLQMLGYDMSWAAFNVVEVMSHTRFTNKRIGYLAASQSFHEGTEVSMLTTNLIRKDFTSSNQYEAGVALNALSNICTPDLARDLASDLVTLMSSSKPYVKKKAVLIMYKIFLRYPDALRPAFPRLKERLEDPDQAVVSSAVNVICELARKNPKNYLSLAPTLFKLLTSNYNNWMLIKIIKLFGALTPLEPRLAKKLVEPLSNLINTTPAMSLLYECIQTCTIGMAEHVPVIKLCITKLRNFIEDPDQNLKYLGLLALNNIMKEHPKAVAEHRDMVLNCLDDEDVTIRMRALDLITGMISKRNLADIVRKLLEHLEKAEGIYRDELVQKIILICSQGSYQYITDFEWYITVLVQMVQVIQGTTHGPLIAGQLLDVAIRVKVVRPFCLRHMTSLMRDARLLANPQPNGVCEVLYAAAYIIGEFSDQLEGIADGNTGDVVSVVEAMLQPRAAVLPPSIQSIFMQNVLKVFTRAVLEAPREANLIGDEEGEAQSGGVADSEMVNDLVEVMQGRLPLFTQSTHLEVQERACTALEFVRLYSEMRSQGVDVSEELASLFDEPLNPVAPKAQKKVPVPEGLDLDQWINDPKADQSSDSGSDSDSSRSSRSRRRRKHKSRKDKEEHSSDDDSFLPSTHKDKEHTDADELERQKEERRRRMANNPYYMPSGKSSPSAVASPSAARSALQEEPNIPIATLPASMGSIVVGQQREAGRDKKGRRRRDVKYEVDTAMEMPEGAANSDDEKDKKNRNKDKNVDALGAVDLNTPLADYEVLHVGRHRVVAAPAKAAEPAKGGKDEEKGKGDKDKDRPRRSRRGEKEAEGKERRHRDRESRRGDKPRSDSKSTPTPAASLIDMDLLSDAPPTSSPMAVSSSAALQASYAELGSPAVEEKKGKEERRSRRDSRGEKDKERDRGDRRGRDEGRSRRDKDDKGSRREKTEERPSSSSSSSSSAPKSTKKPLVEDADIRVLYDTRVPAGAEKGRIMVGLFFENRSSHALSGVEVQFADSMNVRKASGASAAVPEMDAGAKVTHQIAFVVSNISMPQKLKGTLTVGGKKHELAVTLPCSAFVVAEAIGKDKMAEIVTSDSLTLVSSKLTVKKDFKTVVDIIAEALHVERVQAGSGAASLYGKSVLGHHVALLVKERGEGSFSVDLKCSDSALGSSLIGEVNALFR